MGAHDASNASRDGGRTPLHLAVIAIAIGLQLVVAVPFTVAMGLLAPLWAIVVAWVVWLAAAALLVVTVRRRPLRAPIVPIVNAGLLFGFVTLGEAVLGWTA
jgi:hypothetical protein